MSSSIRTEENDLLESLENNKLQLNRLSYSSIDTLFETFIPKRSSVNDNLVYDQQHALYFQAQFPQTNSIASESSIPLSIFIAHTHYDCRLLQYIEQILLTIKYQGNNIGWHPGEIALDTSWKMNRHNYLESVDLILLLVTRAFLATEYCYSDQLKLAIWRHTEEKAYIIPILMEACSWDRTPLVGLYTITPKDKKGIKAVNEWPKSKLALNIIENDIRKAVWELRNGR